MVDSYDDIFVRAFSLLEQTGILAKSYGEWEIGDWGELRAVSYTHLDVYKRQAWIRW